MNPVAPSADELLGNPAVVRALELAWADSNVAEAVRRHEEGGWIYYELGSGAVTVLRAPSGTRRSIDLANPPERPGHVVVGKFHTHPNPSDEGWEPGPSPQDERVDQQHGVPDLIRSDRGVFVSGPVSRRGGLGGAPGYPV